MVQSFNYDKPEEVEFDSINHFHPDNICPDCLGLKVEKGTNEPCLLCNGSGYHN